MLNIYYGRECANKEKFIFDRIRAAAAPGAKPSALLLVPDQFTLQAEKDAFYYLGEEGLMDVEVISMSRLGFRVFAETGGGRQDYIDKYGRHMLLAKLMREQEEQLAVFRGVSQKTSFLEMANNLISEMKQYNTSPEDLKQIAEGMEEDSLLKKKLLDIQQIYEGYEAQIQGKYVDTEDYINAFLPRIAQSKLLVGRQIWVWGFDYFAPKNVDILRELMACAEVNVVIVCDQGAGDEELFRLTSMVIEKLLRTAESAGVSWSRRPVPAAYLHEKKRARAIAAIEENLYALPFAEEEDCRGVNLVRAANPYAEAETAAAFVLQLVRDKGLRYRDMVVICNDLETRGSIVRRVFAEYGINLFVDKKRSILHNPAAAFILSLVNIAASDWRNEDIFRLLKTGLCDIPEDAAEELENYAEKYRIKGRRWKKAFEKGLGEYGEEGLAALEGTRVALVSFLHAFDEAFRREDGAEYQVRVLYSFLADTARIPEKLTKRIEALSAQGRQELADETAQIWDAIAGILSQFAELMGSEVLSPKQFYEMLRAGLSAVEIGLLPPTADGLMMGTMQRTRVGSLRALIVLSANDGLLPAQMQEEGLLNEDEKQLLFEKDVEICKMDELRAMEERMAIYRALAKPSEYLFMSCSLSDAEGKELRPSSVFERIGDIFPRLEVRKDSLSCGEAMERIQAPGSAMKHMAKALRDKIDGEELENCWENALAWYKQKARDAAARLEEGLFYTNAAAHLSRETVKRLFLKDGQNHLVLSPSALERYSRCPFSYFVGYGLRPDEKRIFEMAAREIGDVYHSCLMRLSMELTEKGVAVTAENSRWMTATREQVDEIVAGLVRREAQEYREGVLSYGAQEQYRAGRMEQICSDMAWILIGHVRSGEIQEIAFEEAFGQSEWRKLPPVVVKAGGETVCIEGTIDRVDVLPGEKVKIIDYKSGRERFNLDEARGGWRLQLMLYLAAAQQEKGTQERREPAGVFYFKIDEPLIDAGAMQKEKLKETVSSEIRKSFKLDGVMVDDPDVVKSIAGDFSGYSEIASLRMTAGGVKGTSEGKLLSPAEFGDLQETVNETIEELCDAFLSGEMSPRPKKSKEDTACKYCRYRGICRFDTALPGCRFEGLR